VSPVLQSCGRGRRTGNEAPRPCRQSRRSSPATSVTPTTSFSATLASGASRVSPVPGPFSTERPGHCVSHVEVTGRPLAVWRSEEARYDLATWVEPRTSASLGAKQCGCPLGRLRDPRDDDHARWRLGRHLGATATHTSPSATTPSGRNPSLIVATARLVSVSIFEKRAARGGVRRALPGTRRSGTGARRLPGIWQRSSSAGGIRQVGRTPSARLSPTRCRRRGPPESDGPRRLGLLGPTTRAQSAGSVIDWP
jgi:hypothetical protein